MGAPQDLISLVHQLGNPRVLVLGDIILDRYTWGDAERVSQEAPVIMLRADECEQRLGGSASVCQMLRGLGGEVVLAGVVGNDPDGAQVERELRSLGVDSAAVVRDATRPTTVKHRFMGRAQQRHPYQMLRVDREVREPVSQEIEGQLGELISQQLQSCDILLISDYAKGVCTPALLKTVISLARAAGKRIIVDPVRKGDYLKYRNASAITPNRLEASIATRSRITQTSQALSAAEKLRAELSLEAAIVTLDKEGMALALDGGVPKILPTRSRQVYDITGAGDMVLAVIGMSLAAGADYELAVRLANIAGGLEVEKIGVATVTRQEILKDLQALQRRHASSKVTALADLEEIVESRKSSSDRIVFTNGCFDILHAGHAQYLQEAAAHGDCLIVAINSDSSVRNLKGPQRPIVGEQERAAMLAALEAVDYVVIFAEQTPHNLLERLRPDVLIKGGTYTRDEVVGWEIVQGYGGEVVVASEVTGLSTSSIIEQILVQYGEPDNSQQDGGSPGMAA